VVARSVTIMAAVPKALQARALERWSKAYREAFWAKPRAPMITRVRQRQEACTDTFYREWGIRLNS